METDKIIEKAFIRKGEQEALNALKHLESAEQLRQIMLSTEHKHRSQWPRRSVWIFASVAAVIAVVLTIGLQPRYSANELYMGWHDAVPYEPTISRGEDPEQEKFETALALAMGDNNTEAIEKFRLIAADSSSEYVQDAQWQLVLLYLKTSERTEAKKVLRIVIEEQGEYSHKAKELLDIINRKRWF